MAHSAAKASNDLEEKVGASIRTGINEVLCSCNNLPLGVIPHKERFLPPLKFAFTEHAERSVIYRAAKHGIQLVNATMATTKSPCPECARAIAMSGIATVHTYREREDSSWKEDSETGLVILAEAGVTVVFHTLEP